MNNEDNHISELKKYANILLNTIEENQKKEKILKKQIEEDSNVLESITKEIKYYEQNKESRIIIVKQTEDSMIN